MRGGETGKVAGAGRPALGELYARITLPPEDEWCHVPAPTPRADRAPGNRSARGALINSGFEPAKTLAGAFPLRASALIPLDELRVRSLPFVVPA